MMGEMKHCLSVGPQRRQDDDGRGDNRDTDIFPFTYHRATCASSTCPCVAPLLLPLIKTRVVAFSFFGLGLDVEVTAAEALVGIYTRIYACGNKQKKQRPYQYAVLRRIGKQRGA